MFQVKMMMQNHEIKLQSQTLMSEIGQNLYNQLNHSKGRKEQQNAVTLGKMLMEKD